jgi:acetyl-CoA synthetase
MALPAEPGVVGELMLWRRDKWETTKDLAKIDEDDYFYHAGRADDVIISAGWTMSAVEIENTLLKHPDVREAAVIAVPDATRGQVAKAFIVTNRPPSDDYVDELKTFTRERLSQHEFPRHIAFVSEIPKTPAGKVNRKVYAIAKPRPRSATNDSSRRVRMSTMPEKAHRQPLSQDH